MPARKVGSTAIAIHQLEEVQTIVGRRFRCARFLIEAYRVARIDVLRTRRDQFPFVSLGT
jgi:hypothetical protein